ncbi:hypothetical protein [Mesonia sp. K7]|uniref:hypothetical protein n=1 Tax=Mesonia sp. K7 TaxID=2218606 RepID=UPI000DA8A613|nr:hypothetical protein [Mesonia sp. K7]PZD77407.1 hypothetical protein DNG35_08805 [Mesonia sp. K7]
MLLQTHIPNPEETGTEQQFGWYTLGEFLMTNWFYVTAVILIGAIVLMYSKYKKQERQKRIDEQNANESSTNR